MSLNELDIIYKDNTRLKSRVDKIKEYLKKTRFNNNEVIELDHLSFSTKIPKNELIVILEKGISLGLFTKVYKYYCGDQKMGEIKTDITDPIIDFCDKCVEKHEFTKDNTKIGYKIMFETGTEPIKDINEVENIENYLIGIITALPSEFTAFKAMLNNTKDIRIRGQGAGRRYTLGEIPSRSDARQSIVLALTNVGNNMASARATLLLEHFPSVESIIMVGIGGGVPNPDFVQEHVRLGDIVVSDHKGVVQYDFVKETISEHIFNNPPRPPNASLLEAVRLMEAAEMEGNKPWIDHINYTLNKLNLSRPSNETDILISSNNPDIEINHPKDDDRIDGQPRIFMGTIAAANTLLKNPLIRDELRNKFNVKAVEMETSGIADATWNHGVGYLAVRGICDYCDSKKNNIWQKYAAVVAAAYTKSLLESI